jgi:hypothetical protein
MRMAARETTRAAVTALAVSAAFWSAAGPATRAADDPVERRARAIKSEASQRRWEQIPWLTDLAAGLELAREERRPIFLWATGDDPLERC